MKEFIDNLYDTYNNSHIIKIVTIFPNVMMLTNETYNNENNFDKLILQNIKYYDQIKEFMIMILDITETEKRIIRNEFQILENYGFNAFQSYNSLDPQIKKALNSSNLIKKNTNLNILMVSV